MKKEKITAQKGTKNKRNRRTNIYYNYINLFLSFKCQMLQVMKGASLQEIPGKKLFKKSSNNSYKILSMAQAQDLLVPTAIALPPNSNHQPRRKGIFQELQANSITPTNLSHVFKAIQFLSLNKVSFEIETCIYKCFQQLGKCLQNRQVLKHKVQICYLIMHVSVYLSIHVRCV